MVYQSQQIVAKQILFSICHWFTGYVLWRGNSFKSAVCHIGTGELEVKSLQTWISSAERSCTTRRTNFLILRQLFVVFLWD